MSVSVLSSPASNFQKFVAIKLYISELKYNLDVFTVQMLDEETMKRDVCYLCDKNTKMKTTEFDIDKIFQISCKIA